MRFRSFWVFLACFIAPMAGAMEVVVELHLGWNADRDKPKRFAKMTVPDGNTSEMFLVS